MNNEITAKEAYFIASGEYENMMNRRIEETLCRIYSKIRYAIKTGRMDTSVDIDIVESKYQMRLSSHLNEKGFKTSFHYHEVIGGHFISISWEHLKNEQ